MLFLVNKLCGMFYFVYFNQLYYQVSQQSIIFYSKLGLYTVLKVSDFQ